MRITNLHLIVSFLILSAVGFLWYQRLGKPPAESALPALVSEPGAAPDAAGAGKTAAGDDRLEGIRRRVQETLANANSDIEVARGLGFDVSSAQKVYEQSKEIFSRAQTVEDLTEAKKLAEQAIQETIGPSTGAAPAAGEVLPAAEPGLAPPAGVADLPGLEPPPAEPTSAAGESDYLPGLEPPTDVTAPDVPAAAPETLLKSALPKERPSFYVVQRGDNLWRIAKRPEIYGRGARWVKLWRANEDRVPDFDVLASGTQLTIPAE